MLKQAEEAEASGELRWAATLLNHLVFSDDSDADARKKLADIYTRLGFACEAGTWRNIYLTGAQELRDGVVRLPPGGMNMDVLAATTTAMLLDFAAVRINPEKASARAFKINLELTDRNEKHLLSVGNGVLVHEEAIHDPKAGATAIMKRPDLLMTLFAGVPASTRIQSGDIEIKGDGSLYESLAAMIEPIVANFPVVTP